MGALGMPNIDVIFKTLAGRAIEKSSKGIVLLILKDDTDKTFNFAEYESADKIDLDKFTADNVAYLKDCFLGSPSKVIVARMDTDGVFAGLLSTLKTKRFNWVGIAEGTTQEHTDLVMWVKSINAAENRSYKAIVYKASADDMHVVSFDNEKVKVKGKDEKTGDKYISRLLGVFAGLPFTRSATFYKLDELESVTDVADLDASISSGKLVLFNDEGEVLIARAVNSLTTLTSDQSDDMKKITIVEALDLIKTDIRDTFKKYYIGKFKNKYDNQVLFLSAINSYFRQLEKDDILNNGVVNDAYIDVEAQRDAWISNGYSEASTWPEIKVKNKTFRSSVFLSANIKILDAIEDLKFNISI